MKGNRYYKVKIVPCPSIAKRPEQQECQQTIQVSLPMKLKMPYQAAQFSGVKSKGSCSGIYRSLKNATATEMEFVAIKRLKRDTARWTKGGLNLKCAHFCPARLADSTISLAGNRSGADNAIVGIDKV